MKRLAAGLAGVVAGLFVTWLCLYAFSHVDWPASGKAATGCHEIDKCPMSWWADVALLADVFGPALLLGALNAVAWRRWPLRRWAGWALGWLVLSTAYRLWEYAVRQA